jgi:hypothetical protein
MPTVSPLTQAGSDRIREEHGASSRLATARRRRTEDHEIDDEHE